jgi:putative ABC transport system permease protein
VLVTAMIALPVAALAFAAANYDTFRLTPDEQADRLMGTTQAAVIWPYDGPIAQHPTDTHFISDIFIRDPSSAPPPEPSRERLLALLPPGTGAISDQAGRLTVHTAAGTGTLRARMLDYADPLAAGIYRPLSGRAPASADEVALTPDAVRRIGTGIGGTVRLTDGSRAFRVVGIVEDPSDLAATTVVLHPGALPGEKLSTDRHDLRYLVATPGPLTWAQVKQLNTNGIVAISRHVLAHPPSPAEVDLRNVSVGDGGEAALAAGLIAGMAMLEIILLAGPAFAVGARRRRRDLALVAAAGGTPAHVRRIVLADGVVLGVLAAATGVVLGIVVAAATVRLFEDVVVHVRSGSFRVFPVALATLAALAVATGVLAALVPAWISSRQDVVTALAGRRGITRSRRRWLVLGAALAAVGLAVAGAGAWRINWALILGGLVVVELGLVLCTPSIVGLVARLGRFLPLAPRIALRDTSRNRTAAAPAISAVMAAVVGSLAIGVVFAASSERDRDDYRSASRPGTVAVFNEGSGGRLLPTGPQSFPPEVLEALRSNMPIAQLYEINQPSCDPGLCFVTATPPAARDCPYAGRILQRRPTPAEQRAARRDPRCDGVGQTYIYFGGLGFDSLTVVIDESAAGAVANLPTEDVEPVVAALRAGAVVVSDPRMVDNGRVTLTIASFGSDNTRQTRTVSAPGFAVPHPLQAPITMMTKATASSLGLKTKSFVVLATTTRMPTTAERDRTQAAVGEQFPVLVEEGRRTGSVALLVLAVVAGVITLGAAAIATGLAAADGRADLGTLAAVGASPRVRRMLSLSQSGVIAGLGSLIGAVAGIGAALAILFALNQRYTELWPAPTPYPMAIPWLNVGIALVVVPLIAMLGAGLLTRSRLPIERRL